MTPEKVKKFRLDLGMTKARFAEIINSSPQAVKRYEDGDKIPGTARRIIEAVRYLDDCNMLDGFIEQYVDLK